MTRSSRAALAPLFAVALALVACDKKEDATPPVPQPSATPSASAAATASAAPSVTASASAAPSAEPSASAAASAAPSASASASAKAAPSGSAAPAKLACGTKPLPDCPLQGWMKANANPAVSSGDATKLAESLEKMAKMGPPGYSNWASISNDGAKAARAGNFDAGKASCRTCHDQYKAKYRAEHRDRKI
ncbi:MAG: hypothetical protein IPK71_33335 [Myxococcales bacterium]|nr:hypothetical protein [Myxococcales bacterium]